MKDFDYYKNSMKYPSRVDFNMIYATKRGVLVGEYPLSVWDDMREKPDCGAVETVFDKEGYKAAKAKYNGETNRLMEEFRADIKEEFGLTGHPKADQVWNLAWQYGHSAGFSEVYNHMAEFAPLVVD